MSKAYLTIDDSPSKVMEAKLDFLDRKGIPAMFFCEGAKLEERPELVKEAIRRGFIIGNHSYSHPKFSEISFEKAKKEIKKTEEIIDDIYDKVDTERPGKFFRFPYGDKGGEKKKNSRSFSRARDSKNRALKTSDMSGIARMLPKILTGSGHLM
ncbi:MAG: polysaccharide deacetylase family protein [Candidatus Nanohalobium sp.]